MTKDSLSALPLWERFQKAARERGCSPVRLLTEYMRERLESWEDQQLDEEMRRDAQHSDNREKDAVEMVRRYRQEKRERRAVS